jgi:hypothetical protein
MTMLPLILHLSVLVKVQVSSVDKLKLLSYVSNRPAGSGSGKNLAIFSDHRQLYPSFAIIQQLSSEVVGVSQGKILHSVLSTRYG